MKSYIVTIRKKDTGHLHRVHIAALTLGEAAVQGELSIDNLYEIVKVERLE